MPGFSDTREVIRHTQDVYFYQHILILSMTLSSIIKGDVYGKSSTVRFIK